MPLGDLGSVVAAFGMVYLLIRSIAGSKKRGELFAQVRKNHDTEVYEPELVDDDEELRLLRKERRLERELESIRKRIHG